MLLHLIFTSTGIFCTGGKPSRLKYTEPFLREIEANFRVLPRYHKPEALAIRGVLKSLAPVSLTCFVFLSLVTLIAFEEMNSLTAWRAGLAEADWNKTAHQSAGSKATVQSLNP